MFYTGLIQYYVKIVSLKYLLETKFDLMAFLSRFNGIYVYMHLKSYFNISKNRLLIHYDATVRIL